MWSENDVAQQRQDRRSNCDSDTAVGVDGLICVESCHCRRQGGSGSIRTAPMKPPYKKTREPRGIRLACFSGPIAPAVERQGRFKCAVAILHEGEMPRARRVKKSAQDGLEIHLHVPRLAKPSSNVKHKQILLLHAEAKGLGTRWYLETTQKHLPVRFLYALAPTLICFSFYGPRKLRSMFQDQLF